MGKRKDIPEGFGQSRRAGLKASRARRVRSVESDRRPFSIVWLFVLPPVVALIFAGIFMNFGSYEETVVALGTDAPIRADNASASVARTEAEAPAAPVERETAVEANQNGVAPEPAPDVAPAAPQMAGAPAESPGATVAPSSDAALAARAPAAPAPVEPTPQEPAVEADAPAEILVTATTVVRPRPTEVQPATPSVSACVETLREDDLKKTFYFERGEIGLSESDTQAMLVALRRIMACPDAYVEISGHSDGVGEFGFNVELSWKRAEIALVLAEEYGLDANRIEVIGFGDKRLASTGETEADHALNRRIELSIRQLPPNDRSASSEDP